MASPQTVSVPVAGTYRLDPQHSKIAFATRHMFGLSGVTGSFDLVSGEIVVADPVTGSRVVAEAAAGSFSTGHAKRDPHVKSADFLHADEHPLITFRSSEVAQDGDRWLLRGQLTARGTSSPAELTVTQVQSDDDTLTLRATGKIDRYAHGITKMKGMAGRYVTLDITARATRV